MPERLPYSILTFDSFQNEYIDENTTSTYVSQAEAEIESESLITELCAESGADLSDGIQAYTLYVVGPDGIRKFLTSC